MHVTTTSLAAMILAAAPLAAVAGSSDRISYAANPYALAASCQPSQPVAFVNLALHNGGTKRNNPGTVTAEADDGVLSGSAAMPAIDPGTSVAVQIPLLYAASSGAPIAGAHLVEVVAGTKKLEPLVISIPAGFCTPTPAPVKLPGGSKAVHPQSKAAVQVQPLPAGSLSRTTEQRGAAIAAALKVNAPANLHAVVGGPECAVHVGLLGALICPDMIKSGDLLLGWDWQGGAGTDEIDGYRVYRVDGGAHQLVYTQANKKDVTLVDVPKSAGAAAGRCYAVSAYAGTRESAASPAFCAGGASVAKTVVLQPLHRRSSHASGGEKGNSFNGSFSETVADDPMVVGFVYSAEEHTLGDSRYYQYHRAGVMFDVTSLRDRRLVSAKLRATINASDGAGNNHSCATAIGSGTEFWWKDASWLDAHFPGIAPTDTGPEIAADVTSIVAPWLRGEPNYGFVMKNDDENPNAFTNKRCMTTYIKPLLEVTYY